MNFRAQRVMQAAVISLRIGERLLNPLTFLAGCCCASAAAFRVSVTVGLGFTGLLLMLLPFVSTITRHKGRDK